MRPESVSGLYWSIRGEVACAEHCPPSDDFRWALDGWNPIPITSGQGTTRYQCQHCATDNRAIVRAPYLSADPH
jgi:hypothetical protein